MIAFIGVRSSWLTLARNSLLTRLACSTCVLARTSRSPARFPSVMSRSMVAAPTARPAASVTGVRVSETSTRRPPFASR